MVIKRRHFCHHWEEPNDGRGAPIPHSLRVNPAVVALANFVEALVP
jgi:hypothetical protein